MVTTKKRLSQLLICLLVFSLIAVQASSNQTRFGDTRRITLPSYSILDENAQPLIASSGKIGFVSSVTDGSLISFSTVTGKILSTIVVGESVGQISMIENDEQRLIAVPAANLPTAGHPATVSIVDATKAKQMQLRSLLALPVGAQITPTTQAMLTRDGKYCLIASSFDEPTLYSFNIERGEIVSQFPLLGRPSEIAFFDDGKAAKFAVASSVSNSVSLLKLDSEGQLQSAGSFSPADASFEDANNPAFSADGETVYIGAAKGDKVFAVNADNGKVMDNIAIEAPERLSVTRGANNAELIGVTFIRRPINAKRGGAVILANQGGKLMQRSEFTPPDGIEFSHANNLVFNAGATSAFLASTTGVLFAFSVANGELESYQVVGNELRRLVLSDNGKKVAAVRSNSTGDEIVLASFDVATGDNSDLTLPQIKSINPATVEQGYENNLRIAAQGDNFSANDALIVNGTEVATEITNGGKALEAAVPKSLFKEAGEIQVQVKRADGGLSASSVLRVIQPQAPVVDTISPEQVPVPAEDFTLKVKGKNFRNSSTIFVDGQEMATQKVTDNELQAKVSAEMAKSIKQLAVEVHDTARPEFVSNAKTVSLVGPMITEVKPFNDVVVAGDRSFKLKINGANFREGARLEINGEVVPVSLTKRISEKQIIASVPGGFAQEAKSLAVAVRNPGGDISNVKNIEALAPEIKTFAPNSVVAGEVIGKRVRISGTNFRPRASVYVGDGKSQAFKIDRKRVKFISKNQIVVTFTSRLKAILSKPGVVRVQVVNPNSLDGVSSEVIALNVVGPEIKTVSVDAISGDAANVRLLVQGENFRRGAVIEFIKEGEVISQQAPVNIRNNRISMVLSTRKIEALGNFSVRVINPGDIRSTPATVQHESIASQSND